MEEYSEVERTGGRGKGRCKEKKRRESTHGRDRLGKRGRERKRDVKKRRGRKSLIGKGKIGRERKGREEAM